MLNSWQLKDLQTPLAATAIQGDAGFSSISTDTRTIAEGSLFVALSGPNFNGDSFVETAQAKGAVAAVVNSIQPYDLPQLSVANTRQALGQLGALNRQQFTGPVVAITGSCGKTTVKEMLASILRTQGEVLATQGNLNNEIGVPLTLLQLSQEHQFAVVELGASGLGEIAYTVGLTKPRVAILNNARGAHLEGFGSLAGVVKAKGEIFEGLDASGTGVVNLDDPHASVWLEQLAGKSAKTFSLRSAHADVFASHLETDRHCCYRFIINTDQQQQPVQLQVLGQHMVANALAATSAALALDVPLAAIAQGLADFTGVAGRMSIKRRADGMRVIDDTYNANPDSVKAAIDALSVMPGYRVLVLGKMGELGEDSSNLHREVGHYAAEQKLDMLLTSGTEAGEAAQAFIKAAHTSAALKHNTKQKAQTFADNADLSAWLQGQVHEDMVILVKGSRSAGMESVVQSLLAERTN